MRGVISNKSRPGRDAGFTMIEILIVLVFIAVIAAIAITAGLYAFDAARLGRTVANMRVVSDAIQQYKLDNSVIPGGGLQPVSSIAPVLAIVSGDVPEEDGWGYEIYYENLVIAGEPTYRLYGYGKDGTPDGVITGTWIDFFTDTVIESGAFVQTKW